MELFKLLGTISIDTGQANEAIDETTKKAKDSEGKQSGAFQKIGSAALTGAKAVAGAATTIGGAWLGAIEGTREYRVSMGKLETAFTTSGHSAETAHKTYSTLNSVLGDSDVAVEAANHLAKLVDNEKDMNTWTDICTGVFATFGDSLPIEGLTEAANETAKTGQLTGSLADALNAVSWIKKKFEGLKDVASKVSTTFENIKKTVTDKIDAAKDKVKGFVDKVKGFFPLKIGKIFSSLKIPKISVSGGKAPFGIAGKGKLPSFDVKWNAEGGILTEPTIFGMNPKTGTLLGGGEAGNEAIVPIDRLRAYIDDSVNNRNIELIQSLELQISRLISFMQNYFPENYQILLDTGILAGELAPNINSRLADIYTNNRRGNTR